MADQTPTPIKYQTEGQSRRWLKYGSNTVVVSAVVVLLAVLVVYLAQRFDHQTDTTQAALYSLKPQTLKVIGDNQQHITITSFYSKAKRGDAAYGTGADAAEAAAAATVQSQAGVVADLLDEYASRGRNISVEEIDPKLNPSKADALIEQVTDQYGGEVKKYKDFTDTLGAKYDAIAKTATDERAKVVPLRRLLPDTDEGVNVSEVLASVGRIPGFLKEYQQAYQTSLHQKPPDYKGVADSVSGRMADLSTFLGQVIDGFSQFKDGKTVPAEVRQYMAAATPVYQGMKKQADDLVAQAKGLGELKLDTIREALHQDNAILVRGDKDWKVIRYDQVWKNDARDARGGGTVRPRFAGEQMITTAILGLEQPTKTKVCFVRAGGEPLADTGGPFSSVAARLRDYNFDVSDKDLTGQYAMQAMQQQMPTTPEPSDADVDDAIWVVFNQTPQQNPMMGGPPPGIADKVAAHMAAGHHWQGGKKVAGGSAFVLAVPHGDTLATAVSPFGLTLRSDAMACHALVKAEGASDPNDIMNQAARVPFIFPIKDWGTSAVTDAVRGLPGVMLEVVPVEVAPAPAGVTNQALIPVPTTPDSPLSWGETDLAALESRGAFDPKYDAGTDIPGPLNAAAMGEKADGSRLLVMGSPFSFQGSDLAVGTSIVDMPDPDEAQQHVYAPEFPGNGEFFMDSVFWLAHQEPMIAISPAAMNVARLAPIGRVSQGIWHVGVLLIGLPGLILAAGVAAYLSRQD